MILFDLFLNSNEWSGTPRIGARWMAVDVFVKKKDKCVNPCNRWLPSMGKNRI